MRKALVAWVLAATIALGGVPVALAAGDGPVKVVYHVNEGNAFNACALPSLAW